MIILQLEFVERLVHDRTIASPWKGLFNLTSNVKFPFWELLTYIGK